MSETVVVKFGGSVLENDQKIRRAAGMIEQMLKESKVVVVVSALKGTTDGLIRTARRLNPRASKELLDDILAMGEKTSARLFAAALSRFGLKPVVVDPGSEYWPIVTDEGHLDANPLYEETSKLIRERIVPILQSGAVPIVCGFLGLTKSGKITTLGRGGSDTTATLLGSCLQAREVVLVKDTEGVFSSDPDKVTNPVPLERLNLEEAQILTAGGAKFLHKKALKYLQNGIKVRIASLTSAPLTGTVIVGDIPDLSLTRSASDITMFTILADDVIDATKLSFIIDEIKKAGRAIAGLTVEEKSMIVYVEGGKSLLVKIHDVMLKHHIGKALTSFENLSIIIVKGKALETSPGMVQRVTQPLARKGINIYGLETIGSSIRVFVSEEDADRALSLIKSALMVSNHAGS